MYFWNEKVSIGTMKKNVKDTIISIAQSTFRKYGFRKTTMEEIAYAAGKTKSTMYYYFESKEEVFQAVVEKEVTQLRAEILAAVQAEELTKNKLKAYIFTRMSGFRKMSLYRTLHLPTRSGPFTRETKPKRLPRLSVREWRKMNSGN